MHLVRTAVVPHRFRFKVGAAGITFFRQLLGTVGGHKGDDNPNAGEAPRL